MAGAGLAQMSAVLFLDWPALRDLSWRDYRSGQGRMARAWRTAVGSGWFMDSRIRMITAVAAVGAVLLASGSVAASAGVAAAPGSNGWGTARGVPGTAALNQGGVAEADSVSCASAGNCSAGGSYRDSSGNSQAFVVNRVNGSWHKAIEVPGIAALNQGGIAEIRSV